MGGIVKSWKLLLAVGIGCGVVFDTSAMPAFAQTGESRRERDRRDGDDERRSRWEGRRGDRERSTDGDRDRGRRWGRSRDDDSDSRSERRRSSEDSSARPASSSSATPSSASSSTSGIDMRDYARRLIEQFDRDGNKMLNGDELKSLRKPASEADLNGDGVITLDELVLTLSGKSNPSESSTSAATNSDDEPEPSDSPADAPPPSRSESTRRSRSESATESKRESSGATAANSRVVTNGERKSYRFKTGKDRAPSGLPSYFSRDANGDGQISMHEYASSWDERTAAAFRRLDLNGDGIITAEEALQAK